ncbi:hypothetical protein [Alkalicoccus saliphilus]|uniref:hypothetical protein n=1 Tax=Alkalicoccus saliphilus TaxID=200989 RepID=UPI0011B259F4|nr:hypothetical protein [Alkalicoccus saliphilus]
MEINGAFLRLLPSFSPVTYFCTLTRSFRRILELLVSLQSTDWINRAFLRLLPSFSPVTYFCTLTRSFRRILELLVSPQSTDWINGAFLLSDEKKWQG